MGTSVDPAHGWNISIYKTTVPLDVQPCIPNSKAINAIRHANMSICVYGDYSSRMETGIKLQHFEQKHTLFKNCHPLLKKDLFVQCQIDLSVNLFNRVVNRSWFWLYLVSLNCSHC